MTLRLFGAGGAFSRRYGTTCSMITLRSGQRWLIDCGRQAPDQLHAAGYAWHDITGQIITHVHGDHVYGLEDFAFIRYFESRGGDLATSLGGCRPKMVAHTAVCAEVWETPAPSLRYLNDGQGNLHLPILTGSEPGPGVPVLRWLGFDPEGVLTLRLSLPSARST